MYFEPGAQGATPELREFLPAVPRQVDGAKFSPDGRFVAYESNESDEVEIYVRRFPDGDQRWQVTTDGGASRAGAGTARRSTT